MGTVLTEPDSDKHLRKETVSIDISVSIWYLNPFIHTYKLLTDLNLIRMYFIQFQPHFGANILYLSSIVLYCKVSLHCKNAQAVIQGYTGCSFTIVVFYMYL